MKPRDYQYEAADCAWSSIREGGYPIICIPTGGGKSWVLAELCRKAVTQWGGRALVMAHRKELLQQNAEKIGILLPELGTVGLYSAGLKRRDIDEPVICAGIQSARKNAWKFQRRDVIIIDECHLVPNKDQGTYREFIAAVREVNPHVVVIGLSATPYRTDDGDLTDGGIFTEVCYEIGIDSLIQRGFLCNLTSPRVDSEVSMDGVAVRRGDFVQRQMQDAFLEGDNVERAVDEMLEQAEGRKSIAVFTAGIEHAERVVTLLEDAGEEVGYIDGKTESLIRGATLRSFSEGRSRFLVNVNVLTTGWDCPRVDCVALMRASTSSVLVAQMIGRGLRTHESKEDCLVLDYGQNIARHGALNDPEYGRRKKKKRGKKKSKEKDTVEKKFKICDNCGCDETPVGEYLCVMCGEMFPLANLTGEADDTPVLTDNKPEWREVQEWAAFRHPKKDNPDSVTMRVEYMHGFRSYTKEWVCIEHIGFARTKAEGWWSEHSIAPCPETIDDSIDLMDREALRMPKRIKVIKEGGFWKVLEREFDTDRPATWYTGIKEEIPF